MTAASNDAAVIFLRHGHASISNERCYEAAYQNARSPLRYNREYRSIRMMEVLFSGSLFSGSQQSIVWMKKKSASPHSRKNPGDGTGKHGHRKPAPAQLQAHARAADICEWLYKLRSMTKHGEVCRKYARNIGKTREKSHQTSFCWSLMTTRNLFVLKNGRLWR